MNRIDDTFARLRAEGGKAFMPFLTAGAPDLATTASLVRELARRGATMVELGLPYSDPVADGPTIQESYTKALAKGTRLDEIFQMVRGLREDCEIPIVLMGSFSLVSRRGADRFLDNAASAGADGVILPDLPLEEYEVVGPGTDARDLSHIMLIAPTTPWDRAERIARHTTGFLYVVSVAGITGERDKLPDELVERVRHLREITDLPVCVGFGISRPEHVAQVCSVADGAIVGSAIVRRIGAMEGRPTDEIVRDVGEYASELIAALPRSG